MRWLRLLCVVVLLSLTAPARTAPVGGPFADVPQQHWAYDAVQSLAQKGFFTGFPDGMFSGRRALTRYEFAVAVQRLLQDANRLLVNDRWPMEVARSPREAQLRRAVLWRLDIRRRSPDVTNLMRLTIEFAAELAMLGADPEQESARIEALGVTRAPTIPPRLAVETTSWRHGVERAQSEWENGRATLYEDQLAEASVLIDSDLGLPFAGFAKRADEEVGEDGEDPTQFMAGHNDEIYRLIIDFGLPANARRKWLDQILSPQQVFEEGGPPVARLDAAHRNTATRRRDIHVRADVARTSRLQALEVALDGRILNLTPFSPEATVTSVDLVIGPPTSDVLFLRFVELRPDGAETVYQVVDLRNGKPLKMERVPVDEP